MSNDYNQGHNHGCIDSVVAIIVFCVLAILSLPFNGYVDRHPECAGMTAYECYDMRTDPSNHSPTWGK